MFAVAGTDAESVRPHSSGSRAHQPVRCPYRGEQQANGIPTFRFANETKPLKCRPKKLVE